MNLRPKFMALLAAVACLVMSGSPAFAEGPLHTLELRGTLSPPLIAQFHSAIDSAVSSGATALFVMLDSEGVISADASLLTPMLEAPLPVVVFIPPGGQAAGGAATLAALADVLIIAPDATLGPALPFQLADGIQGSVDPVTEGLSEYNQLRRLLPPGPMDTGVTAERLSVETLSAQQAVELGLAEATATDRDAAIAALASRTVDKGGVSMPITLTPTTPLVAYRAGAADRLLVALARPGVGYLGFVGVIVALLLFAFSRGGATFLLGLVAPLAAYSLVMLPARWWAVALLVAALVALAWDIRVAWFGVPTVIGVVLLTTGSVTLFSGVERLAVPPYLVALACVGVVGLSLVARQRQDREALERQSEEMNRDIDAARRARVGLARDDARAAGG